ncbi:MAG: hypothetical protein ACI33P_09490 [Lysinibacillus sp.]
MLAILQIVFSIAVIALGCYGLITENFELQWLMVLFIAVTMLIIAIRDFQQKKKLTGWLFVFIFLFVLFVVIRDFALL